MNFIYQREANWFDIELGNSVANWTQLFPKITLSKQYEFGYTNSRQSKAKRSGIILKLDKKQRDLIVILKTKTQRKVKK